MLVYYGILLTGKGTIRASDGIFRAGEGTVRASQDFQCRLIL